MVDVVWLIVLGLATWRICHLIIFEPGPFDVFGHIRGWAVHSAFFSELVSCIYCLSVWVGIGVWVIALTPARALLVPFALSAAAVMVQGYVSDDG